MASIDSSFLLKPMSTATQKKCEAILQSYPKAEPRWKWAPNAADYDLLSPPSGFSLSVNADAKVAPDVFHPRKMFYGTAAFEIPADLLSPARFLEVKDEIGVHLLEYIRETSPSPPSISNYSTTTHRDAEEWQPALGGRGAYAGVFASEKRGDDEYVGNLWLVVRAGVPEASEELYEKLEKEGAVKTWKQFFLEDKETLRVYDFASRNRQRILALMANAVLPGRLQVRKDFQSHDQKKMVVLEPTIETLSHTVEFDDTEQRATYYSNTVDATTIQREGYIFNETPALGPILVKQSKRYSGFRPGQILPTSTGRQEMLNAGAGKLRMAAKDTFVWEGDADNNKRLDHGIFGVRNEAFKAIEAKMGYDHTVTELALKPLIVKVATCDSSTR